MVNVCSLGPTLSATDAPGSSTIASTEVAPRVMTIGCVALGLRTVTLAGGVAITRRHSIAVRMRGQAARRFRLRCQESRQSMRQSPRPVAPAPAPSWRRFARPERDKSITEFGEFRRHGSIRRLPSLQFGREFCRRHVRCARELSGASVQPCHGCGARSPMLRVRPATHIGSISCHLPTHTESGQSECVMPRWILASLQHGRRWSAPMRVRARQRGSTFARSAIMASAISNAISAVPSAAVCGC